MLAHCNLKLRLGSVSAKKAAAASLRSGLQIKQGLWAMRRASTGTGVKTHHGPAGMIKTAVPVSYVTGGFALVRNAQAQDRLLLYHHLKPSC
jgi:hypothetical protein